MRGRGGGCAVSKKASAAADHNAEHTAESVEVKMRRGDMSPGGSEGAAGSSDVGDGLGGGGSSGGGSEARFVSDGKVDPRKLREEVLPSPSNDHVEKKICDAQDAVVEDINAANAARDGGAGVGGIGGSSEAPMVEVTLHGDFDLKPGQAIS